MGPTRQGIGFPAHPLHDLLAGPSNTRISGGAPTSWRRPLHPVVLRHLRLARISNRHEAMIASRTEEHWAGDFAVFTDEEAHICAQLESHTLDQNAELFRMMRHNRDLQVFKWSAQLDRNGSRRCLDDGLESASRGYAS